MHIRGEVTIDVPAAEVGFVVGGVAAALAAVALLAGTVSMATGRRPWCPWLAVLFAFNARYRSTSRDALRGVPPIDVGLLLLAGTTYAAFWPGPGASHPAWLVLAIAQPVLGIVLLVVTRLSGRSGLMGGGLVLSILMLVSGAWPAVAWLGLAANVLLLIGDFGTTTRPSRILGRVIATGYGALVVWFGALAALLLI